MQKVTRTLRRLSLIFGILFSASCASDLEKFRLNSEVELSKEFQIPKTATKELLGKVNGARWMSCQQKPNLPWVLVLDSERLDLLPKSCDFAFPQAFISNGYNVLVVRLSERGEDYGGVNSMKQIRKVLASQKVAISGVWGHHWHSILGARIAREEGVAWAFLNDGLFDLEFVLENSQESSMKKVIQGLVKKEGEEALELRSVSWDLEGLPKTIYITQSNFMEPVLIEQVQTFTQGLAAAGHSVTAKSFQVSNPKKALHNYSQMAYLAFTYKVLPRGE